jgi:hypothetical protein
MSGHVFYQRGRNKGNERQIILRSAILLVNRAKEKRIKMKVSLPLTGRKATGTPEWITNAMTFVAQSHDIVSPVVEFGGFDIAFSDDNLFENGAKASKCQMKSFVVQEVGNSETPDIDLQFVIYSPFSTALWKWCGQMGGEEFWASFVQVDEPEKELELAGDDNEEEGEEEEPES